MSWEVGAVQPDTFGLKQSAYQILVATSLQKLAAGQGDLWDSGKIVSDETIHVPYAATPLGSRQVCHWKVRVWDQDGVGSDWSAPARWSMGLLVPCDWQAVWVGDATSPPPDSQAHNGYRSENASKSDAVKWVCVDLQQTSEIDSVALFGARPYNQIPPDAPGHLFPIRFRILTAQQADFSDARTVCDETQADVFNPAWGPWVCRIQPLPAVHAGFSGEGTVPYRRYAITEDGVSPRLLPGQTHHLVVADSDEHTEDGHITEDPETRVHMTEKRLFAKLPAMQADMAPPFLYGVHDPEIVIACWGSLYGLLREAVDELSRTAPAAMLHFSEIFPFPATEHFDYLKLLNDAKLTICVEQNATGQFSRLMRTEKGFEFGALLTKYDGRPFTVESLVKNLKRQGPKVRS